MGQTKLHTRKRYSFTPKKKNKDVLFVENYYRDSSHFYEVSFREFVLDFFSDACIRHKDSRLVVCEMVSNGDHTPLKKQEAHRVREEKDKGRIKPTHTHISPFLYRSEGKYRGKGIRLKSLVSASVGIGLDFDSLELFSEADKKKDALKLPEWDAVIYTGGRGVQVWYYLDPFPLRTQNQIEFYENVKNSLVALLGSDPKAKLLTQLLRLPDTPHPRTGRKSQGYVRRGFKKNSKGKLLRLANILKSQGALKSTPMPKRERKYKGKIFEGYRERIRQRLSQGTYTGTYSLLAKELGLPTSSLGHLMRQFERRGEYSLTPLRKGQRNAGLKIEKIKQNQEHPQKQCRRVHLYKKKNGYSRGLCSLYSEYLQSGANVAFRNTTLFTLALYLFSLRVSVPEAWEFLRSGNLKSPRPLSDIEFQRTFDSAFSGKYGGASCHWLSEIENGQGVEEKKESLPQSAFDFRDFESVFGNVRVIEISKSGNKTGRMLR